jgi:hypothetical protein
MAEDRDLIHRYNYERDQHDKSKPTGAAAWKVRVWRTTGPFWRKPKDGESGGRGHDTPTPRTSVNSSEG